MTPEYYKKVIDSLESQGATPDEIQGILNQIAKQSNGQISQVGQRFDVAGRSGAIISDAQQQSQQFGQTLTPMGTAKRYASEVGQVLTPGTMGVGEAIFQGIDQGGTAQELAAAYDQITSNNIDLYKEIMKTEAAGNDSTRLKQVYNENQQQLERLSQEIDKYSQVQKPGEFLGNLGSMALDLFTAGTYGKSAAGLKAGILGKATPSAVKQIANPLTPGMKALDRFKAGAQTVGVGAGIGYGYDVAEQASGRLGEEAQASPFTPGIGTGFGVALGSLPIIGILGGKVRMMSSKTAREVANIEKRRLGLKELEIGNAKVARSFEAARRSGVDPIEVLSTTDLLNGAVTKEGRLDTSNALAKLQSMIDPVEGLVRKVIRMENAKVSYNDLRAKMVQSLEKTQLQGADRTSLIARMKSELKGFRAVTDEEGMIDLMRIQTAKTARQKASNWADPEATLIRKEMSRIFKEVVEENVTNMDVKTFNQELAKAYAIRSVLGRKGLKNAVVKGGRLGKYFSSTIGGIIGAKVGGGLGAIAGAEVGSQIRALQLINSLGGKIPADMRNNPKMVEALGIYAEKFGVKADFVEPPKKPTFTEKAGQLLQKAKENLTSERGSIGGESQYDKYAGFRAKQKAAQKSPVERLLESSQNNSTVQAFRRSTGQKKIATVDGVRFEIGTFGKNAFERKAGQKDRLPLSEVKQALKDSFIVLRASDNPKTYRYGNKAFLSKEGDNYRVVYTRTNAAGAEEVINAHRIPAANIQKYLEDIGIPSQTRTGIESLEGSEFVRLTYGDKLTIQQQLDKINNAPVEITNNLGKKILKEKIAGKEPLLNTKREMVVKDLQGRTHTLVAGEAIQATRLTNGNYHLIDGEEFVVNKNQFENLKNNSLIDTEPIPFAPELTDTTETYLGAVPKARQSLREGASRYGVDFHDYSASSKNNRGENYSMIVVQAPKTKLTPDEFRSYLGDKYTLQREGDIWVVRRTKPGPNDSPAGITRKDNLNDLAKVMNEREGLNIPVYDNFTGGHVIADNQLFHIRGFEDTYKGEKVWFNDEFQSDWNLALRREAEEIARKFLPSGATDVEVGDKAMELLRAYRKGIQPTVPTELPKGWEVKKIGESWHVIDTGGYYKGTADTKKAVLAQYFAGLKEDTQFKTPYNEALDKWLDSAIKRSLMEAEARGAEWMVWSNGAQIRDLYSSIYKQIESVTWRTNDGTKGINGTKTIEVRPVNRSFIAMDIAPDGKILDVSPDSYRKEMVGKNIKDMFLTKNAKQIIADESGSLAGDDMVMGGTWTESLYEENVVNRVADITGEKPETIDMGYQLSKDRKKGVLTEQQIERLMDEGIDPELGYGYSTGDVVTYFGEDYRVIEDTDNGYWMVREEDIQTRFDVDSYRQDAYESIYENFTYGDEIPYYSEQWAKEMQRFTDADGVITIPENRWNNRNEQRYYLVEDGDWGSDARGQWPTNENQPPKLVNADDVDSFDLEYEGFTKDDFIAYIQNKLEDGPVQKNLFGNDKKKSDLIEDWIAGNEQFGDDAFIKSLIDSDDINISELVEDQLNDRGLDTVEGAAADWYERSGEETMVVGDEFWVTDGEGKIFAPTDEATIESLKAENRSSGIGTQKQPAIRLTETLKAKIRGDKLPLNQPSNRSSLLLPMAGLPLLYLLLANEETS